MTIIAELLGIFGLFALGSVLWRFGRISQRMAQTLHTRPYYLGLYVSALLLWTSVIFRFIFLTGHLSTWGQSVQNILYILLVDGLPSLGITLALLVAWYYWSWLLAERE